MTNLKETTTRVVDVHLKPCPFCGSTDVKLVSSDDKSYVSVTCKDCNVWVDHLFCDLSEEQMVALWNRRAKE